MSLSVLELTFAMCLCPGNGPVSARQRKRHQQLGKYHMACSACVEFWASLFPRLLPQLKCRFESCLGCEFWAEVLGIFWSSSLGFCCFVLFFFFQCLVSALSIFG